MRQARETLNVVSFGQVDLLQHPPRHPRPPRPPRPWSASCPALRCRSQQTILYQIRQILKLSPRAKLLRSKYYHHNNLLDVTHLITHSLIQHRRSLFWQMMLRFHFGPCQATPHLSNSTQLMTHVSGAERKGKEPVRLYNLPSSSVILNPT